MAGADYYELNIAETQDGQRSSIYSTAKTQVELNMLLSNMTYWMRLRWHVAGSPSLGPTTWAPVGPSVTCTTGEATGALEPAWLADELSSTASTFMLEVMRESEYTEDVDYLMNHNSGDVGADVGFITFTAGQKAPFLPADNFSSATFTLYCLEVLKANVPNTVTTGGNPLFADYVSCNDQSSEESRNHSDPRCGCDNWIDRIIGDSTMDACHRPDGSACSNLFNFSDTLQCNCTCSESSLSYSNKYTGMTPVSFHGFGGTEVLGRWYSHPKVTECSEDEAVGEVRSDGSTCTWKRRPFARTLRGWQLLKEGFQIPGGDIAGNITALLEKVDHNTNAFRKAFQKQKYKPWTCEPAPFDIIV